MRRPGKSLPAYTSLQLEAMVEQLKDLMDIFGYGLELSTAETEVEGEVFGFGMGCTDLDAEASSAGSCMYSLRVASMHLPHFPECNRGVQGAEMGEGGGGNGSPPGVGINRQLPVPIRGAEDQFGRQITDLRRSMTCNDTKPFERKEKETL